MQSPDSPTPLPQGPLIPFTPQSPRVLRAWAGCHPSLQAETPQAPRSLNFLSQPSTPQITAQSRTSASQGSVATGCCRPSANTRVLASRHSSRLAARPGEQGRPQTCSYASAPAPNPETGRLPPPGAFEEPAGSKRQGGELAPKPSARTPRKARACPVPSHT